MHVDLMFPSKYLKGVDILAAGRDVTVEISDIREDELRKQDNSTEKAWVVSLAGTDKLWVLNKTNAKRIAGLHGTEADDWIGKRVTLTTERVFAFGKNHDAIRVRNEIAKGAAA